MPRGSNSPSLLDAAELSLEDIIRTCIASMTSCPVASTASVASRCLLAFNDDDDDDDDDNDV